MFPKASDFQIMENVNLTGFGRLVFKSRSGGVEIPFWCLALQHFYEPEVMPARTVVQLYDDQRRLIANVRVQLCTSTEFDAATKGV